jgi:hypothetical protein
MLPGVLTFPEAIDLQRCGELEIGLPQAPTAMTQTEPETKLPVVETVALVPEPITDKPVPVVLQM